MNYFVIGGDGQRYGPEDIAVLQGWVREHRIVANSVLIEAPTGRTVRAADLPALAIYLLPDHPVHPPSPPPHAARTNAAPRTQRHFTTGQTVGPKNKVVAGLLGLFLGSLGIHRYYLGSTFWGTIQLLGTVVSCGALSPAIAIWGAIEGICCFAGWMNDADGRALRD